MSVKRIFIFFAVCISFAFALAFFVPSSKNVIAQTANGGRAKVFGLKLDNGANGQINFSMRIDRDIRFKAFTLPNPTPRLVIDFPRVDWAMGRGDSGIVAGRGIVKQLRFAHKSIDESRIVFDLSGPVKITNQSISNSMGGRSLNLTLSPSDAKAFVSAQPKPRSTTSAFPFPSPLSPRLAGRKYVIVIDAGHGGHDPGAIGFTRGVYEKNVTLASALYLRDILRKDQRFQVILTRESDVFLPLEKRIIIARDLRADLFISLHADAAAAGTNAEGATVYTLSEQGGERSRKLLNRDNWTVAPPNRSRDNIVTEILRDLTQRDTKNQSAVFAEGILRNIRGVGPLTSSSHRRAGFFVLLSPTVPAVLFEMGFITDQEDEARLVNASFRARQMNGVAKAIDDYFDSISIKVNGNK